jgi:hypothetical protein
MQSYYVILPRKREEGESGESVVFDVYYMYLYLGKEKKERAE